MEPPWWNLAAHLRLEGDLAPFWDWGKPHGKVVGEPQKEGFACGKGVTVALRLGPHEWHGGLPLPKEREGALP